MPEPRVKAGPAPFFVAAAGVFIADQLTKYGVRSSLDLFQSRRITSFFNIVYVENTGSAFGLFRSLGNVFFVTIAVVAVITVVFLLVKDHDNRLAFSLILGGAVGNLSDRLLYGHVVDFLDFHLGGMHWPAFNIADSALTLGIALLAFRVIFPHHSAGLLKGLL